MWNTFMPESRNGCRSRSVNEVGSLNQVRACPPTNSDSVAYRLNGFSMSITVERCTRSIARAEYFCVLCAKSWKLPRLSMGAATAADAAATAAFKMDLREVCMQVPRGEGEA